MVIPVDVGALGAIADRLPGCLAQIQGTISELELQKSAILGTTITTTTTAAAAAAAAATATATTTTTTTTTTTAAACIGLRKLPIF